MRNPRLIVRTGRVFDGRGGLALVVGFHDPAQRIQITAPRLLQDTPYHRIESRLVPSASKTKVADHIGQWIGREVFGNKIGSAATGIGPQTFDQGLQRKVWNGGGGVESDTVDMEFVEVHQHAIRQQIGDLHPVPIGRGTPARPAPLSLVGPRRVRQRIPSPEKFLGEGRVGWIRGEVVDDGIEDDGQP